MQALSTIVLVQSVPKAQGSVERLLRAQHLSSAQLQMPEGILRCRVLTHPGPWECSTAGEVDPAPPGHMFPIR